MTARLAILDDYQRVALTRADWSPLDGRADITVFDRHLGNEDAVVEGGAEVHIGGLVGVEGGDVPFA